MKRTEEASDTTLRRLLREKTREAEILHQIAHSGLKYVEAPVTIEYSSYSLAKGQRVSASITILLDLLARGLHR